MTAPNPPGALFEEGCSLCGSKAWRKGSVLSPNCYGAETHVPAGCRGAKYCGDCFDLYGDHNGLWAEISRRRKPSEEPMPEDAFKVGDAVEWNACGLQTGVVTAVEKDGTLGIRSRQGHMYTMVKPTSVRPAASAHRTEYFDAQPDPLPERLPAGTRALSSDRIYTASSGLILKPALKSPAYWGRWLEPNQAEPDSHDTWIEASAVDWSTVKRAPSANPPEAPIAKPERVTGADKPGCVCRRNGLHCSPDWCQAAEPSVWGIAAATVETPVPKRSDRYDRNRCNEPGCDCPYCRHRAWSPKLGANDPRYPASTLDASIRASLETDGKARREAARHASDWDVDDSPENYSTF